MNDDIIFKIYIHIALSHLNLRNTRIWPKISRSIFLSRKKQISKKQHFIICWNFYSIQFVDPFCNIRIRELLKFWSRISFLKDESPTHVLESIMANKEVWILLIFQTKANRFWNHQLIAIDTRQRAFNEHFRWFWH